MSNEHKELSAIFEHLTADAPVEVSSVFVTEPFCIQNNKLSPKLMQDYTQCINFLVQFRKTTGQEFFLYGVSQFLINSTFLINNKLIEQFNLLNQQYPQVFQQDVIQPIIRLLNNFWENYKNKHTSPALPQVIPQLHPIFEEILVIAFKIYTPEIYEANKTVYLKMFDFFEENLTNPTKSFCLFESYIINLAHTITIQNFISSFTTPTFEENNCSSFISHNSDEHIQKFQQIINIIDAYKSKHTYALLSISKLELTAISELLQTQNKNDKIHGQIKFKMGMMLLQINKMPEALQSQIIKIVNSSLNTIIKETPNRRDETSLTLIQKPIMQKPLPPRNQYSLVIGSLAAISIIPIAIITFTSLLTVTLTTPIGGLLIALCAIVAIAAFIYAKHKCHEQATEKEINYDQNPDTLFSAESRNKKTLELIDTDEEFQNLLNCF